MYRAPVAQCTGGQLLRPARRQPLRLQAHIAARRPLAAELTGVTALAAVRVPRAQRCRGRRAARRLVTCMGIKAVEAFDGSFMLGPEAEETLKQHLSGDTFCKQVARQCNLEEGAQLEFSGILFQPVPWSVTSKRGMPAELEPYADDPEHYTIINVPPNFMFSSKIFKPSRLCAVYKRKT